MRFEQGRGEQGPGTRITAVALLRLHSPRSGVTVTEQIRTRAVSTVSFSSA